MQHITTLGAYSLHEDGMEYVVTCNDVEVLRTRHRLRAERELRHMHKRHDS